MNFDNAIQRAMAWYPISDPNIKTLDEMVKYYSHELEINKTDYDKQFRISLALYELGVSVTP